jgi:hypothetical protein
MVAIYTVCNKYRLHVDAVVVLARYVLTLECVLSSSTQIALTYLRNLAGTHELPEDDTRVLKHVAAVQ